MLPRTISSRLAEGLFRAASIASANGVPSSDVETSKTLTFEWLALHVLHLQQLVAKCRCSALTTWSPAQGLHRRQSLATLRPDSWATLIASSLDSKGPCHWPSFVFLARGIPHRPPDRWTSALPATRNWGSGDVSPSPPVALKSSLRSQVRRGHTTIDAAGGGAGFDE